MYFSPNTWPEKECREMVIGVLTTAPTPLRVVDILKEIRTRRGGINGEYLQRVVVRMISEGRLTITNDLRITVASPRLQHP